MKNGPEKNMCCGGIILWWGFKGFHVTQMNSMIHGTHLDVLLCPKTRLKDKLYAISKNPQNRRRTLAQPCGGQWLYSPVWGRPMASFIKVDALSLRVLYPALWMPSLSVESVAWPNAHNNLPSATV